MSVISNEYNFEKSGKDPLQDGDKYLNVIELELIRIAKSIKSQLVYPIRKTITKLMDKKDKANTMTNIS